MKLQKTCIAREGCISAAHACDKLTDKMVIPEDGDECQNMSNGVTWCMKDSVLSVGFK